MLIRVQTIIVMKTDKEKYIQPQFDWLINNSLMQFVCQSPTEGGFEGIGEEEWTL